MIFGWILFLNNPENGQNGPLRGQNLSQILISEDIYRPFKLKIHLQVVFVRKKIIPKQLPKSPQNGVVDPKKGENDPL